VRGRLDALKSISRWPDTDACDVFVREHVVCGFAETGSSGPPTLVALT